MRHWHRVGMELPETGVQITIGDEEALTAAARTRSMRIEERDNVNQIRSHQNHVATFSICTTAQRRPTELCYNHPENHQSDEDAKSKDAFVLPPHLAPHGACTTAKSRRLTRHVVGLVNKQLDALPAAEDLLHVLHHDVLHLSELRLRARKVIRGRRRVVRVHELRDNRAEG